LKSRRAQTIQILSAGLFDVMIRHMGVWEHGWFPFAAIVGHLVVDLVSKVVVAVMVLAVIVVAVIMAMVMFVPMLVPMLVFVNHSMRMIAMMIVPVRKMSVRRSGGAQSNPEGCGRWESPLHGDRWRWC